MASPKLLLLNSEAGERNASPSQPVLTSTQAFTSLETPEPQTTGLPEDESRYEDHSTGWNGKLIACFVLFVVTATGNYVFQKLQAISMYNYANFNNLFTCIIYVPLCFLYIVPATKCGLIPPEQFDFSKKPFAVMGCLDALGGVMVALASVKLNGPLLILLAQSGIPISMIFSRCLLKKQYGRWEYLGALAVITGVFVVLEPYVFNGATPGFICVAISDVDCAICREETTETGCLSRRQRSLGSFDDAATAREPSAALVSTAVEQFWSGFTQGPCRWVESDHSTSGATSTLVWSGVMISASVPLALSSIYKESTLLSNPMDPVLVNAWVAMFQVLALLVLAVPVALASAPPVMPWDVPGNFVSGFKCYFGVSTIKTGCHLDDCSMSALYTSMYIIFNFAWTQFMILLLTFGSASIMFLGLAMVVPFSNLTFSLPFVPTQAPFNVSAVVGLVVITIGIATYGFGSILWGRCIQTLIGGYQLSGGSRVSMNEPLLPETIHSSNSTTLT